MFTFPEIVALPEVDRREPPLSVRFPVTVRALVPLVREPELIVNDVALNRLSWLTVPVTVTAAND